MPVALIPSWYRRGGRPISRWAAGVVTSDERNGNLDHPGSLRSPPLLYQEGIPEDVCRIEKHNEIVFCCPSS
jgi:hypothetical protein